jgi:hypothetical protein
MENEKKKVSHYHRLADVSLRTLSTVLAVLFAYVLASARLSPELKTYVTGIWLLILFGIISSGISLLSDEKTVSFAKWGAIIGIFLMFITIAVMILFLSAIMYSMP